MITKGMLVFLLNFPSQNDYLMNTYVVFYLHKFDIDHGCEILLFLLKVLGFIYIVQTSECYNITTNHTLQKPTSPDSGFCYTVSFSTGWPCHMKVICYHESTVFSKRT